jgi:hypothetical protein
VDDDQRQGVEARPGMTAFGLLADGPSERRVAGIAETGAPWASPIRVRPISVEAGLHRTDAPRFAAGDERQRSRRVERAWAGDAGRRFLFPAGPRYDRFASHRTTFLTGLNADHRVMLLPDECIMS